MRSTEDLISIRASDLYSRGRPRRTSSPIERGWRSGGVTGRIAMMPLDDRVACTYSRIEGEEGRDFPYAVPVSWSTPNYGGQRAWLHCAKVGCRRRCGRLFLDDPYLVCRACAGLRYQSQLDPQPKYVRWAERAKAIRRRLEGPAIPFGPHPPKPQGMHRRTYERLVDELDEAEFLFRILAEEAFKEGEESIAAIVGHAIKPESD
jgi:hypothetical protein